MMHQQERHNTMCDFACNGQVEFQRNLVEQLETSACGCNHVALLYNPLDVHAHFETAAGSLAVLGKLGLPEACGIVVNENTALFAAECPEAAKSTGRTIDSLRRR